MISIILVVISQILSTAVAILDKFIVTGKTMPKPISYTFYVAMFSGLPAIILIFIPEVWNSLGNIKYSFSGQSLLWMFVFGYSVLLAWYLLFLVLKTSDASDVAPIVSATSILFTWLISGFIGIGLGFGAYSFLGIILLVIGTVLISHLRFTKKKAFILILVGVLFALNIIAAKKLFIGEDFFYDLFVTRIAHLITALSMLLFSVCRKDIFSGSKEVGVKGGILVFVNRAISALSELILFKAIQIGNVVIIQTLKSLQFIFLFLFALFFGKITPHEYGENVTNKDLIQKAISTVLMVAGFALLFV